MIGPLAYAVPVLSQHFELNIAYGTVTGLAPVIV